MLLVTVFALSTFLAESAGAAAFTTAPSLSLPQAIAIAIAKNPGYQAAQADIGRAAAELEGARIFFPQNPTVRGLYGREGSRGTGDREWEIGLSQSFYIPGQRAAQEESASLERMAADARFAQAREDLALQVASAYAEYLVSSERLRLSQSAVEGIAKLRAAERQRYETGLTSRLSFGQIEAEAAKLERDYLASESEAVAAKNELALALGVPATELGIPVWPAAATRPTTAPREVPQLQAARFEAEAGRARVTAEQLLRIPQPTIGASLSYNQLSRIPGSPVPLAEKLYTLGVELPLPLWQRRQAEIGRARAAALQSESNLVATRQRTIAAQTNAEAALQAAEKSLQGFASAAGNLSDSIQLINRAYDLGQIGVIEYLTSLGRVYQFQFDYARARADLVRSWARYLSARGQAYEIMSQP